MRNHIILMTYIFFTLKVYASFPGRPQAVELFLTFPSLSVEFEQANGDLFSYESAADGRQGFDLTFDKFNLGLSSSFDSRDEDENGNATGVRTKSTELYLNFPTKKFILRFYYQDFQGFNLVKENSGSQTIIGELPNVKALNISFHATFLIDESFNFIYRTADFKESNSIEKGWFGNVELSYNELNTTEASQLVNTYGIGKGIYSFSSFIPSLGYQYAQRWNEFSFVGMLQVGFGLQQKKVSANNLDTEEFAIGRNIGVGLNFLYALNKSHEIGIYAVLNSMAGKVDDDELSFINGHSFFFYRYNFES